ncbi:hypothetical protein SSX86_031149 [Deinandra increscens subsp. villosa]|uniref:Uncharacterized protein n=1 Tax=Deinandra increscens subsp. villosa TaxID=3103831 RepID=A0AAP0CAG4_9ASTR
MTSQSKFVKWIADANFPKKLRMPSTVSKYGGLADPEDHVFEFYTAARLEGWAEETWCHMFVQTFTGLARVWFDALPSGGIESFEDLRIKFLRQFSQQKRCVKDTTEVHNIRRKDNENIEDFVSRFNKESMRIVGAGDQLRISGFCHGVRNSQLVEKLHENLPTSMESLMDRVRAFVRGKNACSNMWEMESRKAQIKSGGVGQNVKNSGPIRGNQRGGTWNSWNRTTGGRDNQYGYQQRNGFYNNNRHGKYVELIKTPSEILATEQVDLPIPAKQRPASNRNLDKYCAYHRDKGHTTDSCFVLKREIDKAVRSGKLGHLVKVIQEGKQDNKAMPVIHMVHLRQDSFLQRNVRGKVEDIPRWMSQEITFPPIRQDVTTEEPVVITAQIGGFEVHRVYIDCGSATEIMYESCFRQFDADVRGRLVVSRTPLIGFAGEMVRPMGEITLPVTLGHGGCIRTLEVKFLVVKATSIHNVILGRPILRKLGAVISVVHGMIQFPTPRGVATMISDACVRIMEVRAGKDNTTVVSDEDERKWEERLLSERWVINEDFPDQKIQIGSDIQGSVRHQLFDLLKENVNVFAWQPSDMTGVPRDLSEHCLNVCPDRKPYHQHKRGMDAERAAVVKEEVDKLLEAGILREVQYPAWLANPVLVKKPDGSWRMCIDFKDLNNACPKDCYPLPEIDSKVDALAGFSWKCFLDAYKGYHQIQMAVDDEDKTAFITREGTYCYMKMPFGLKNAGATYQRLMDKTFQPQVGRNLEAYVDDIVIKSKSAEEMILDIKETFGRLCSINMKLNPKKCSFGMESGKFLGVFVSKEGIQASKDKVEAVVSMRSPTSIKEVQILNGRLVALHRFLAKAADMSLPFMKVLKDYMGKNEFCWSQEAENAFAKLKEVLVSLPTLTAPQQGECLYMYIATSEGAVSAVLLAERNKVQIPIYYVSKVLKEYEGRYPPLERLVLALVVATRRLRRYFQAHRVEVYTAFPIRQILRRPEMSGRLAKWAIELGQFDIMFRPRISIKGQVVADFLAEIPQAENGELLSQESEGMDSLWRLYTDGSVGSDGSGAGLMLVSPEGDELTYALKFNFDTSNNEAEYEAFLAGLRLAKQLGARKVLAHVDSLLVANQVNGDYEAKGANMALYLGQVKKLMGEFLTCEVMYVPRSQNKKADALSKLASTAFNHLAKEVRVEVLENPSVPVSEVLEVQVSQETWMDALVAYFRDEMLPEDKAEARKVYVNSFQYQFQNNILYRKTFLGPLLRCLTMEEALKVTAEVHSGICGSHAGARMVVTKLVGLGYYWPGMHKTVMDELKKCDECQRHAPVSLKPKHAMVPVTSAWPFQKWGIDIVGPFPEAAGRVKFLIVAVDYFTKWVEAKPLASITGQQVKKFVWEHIICRFGLPLCIVSDNGKQFADNPFREWCEELAISQTFTSVAHPQANGQVERMNRSIVEGIKMRLEKIGGGWVDELLHVLWSLRTMPKSSHGETPFSLTYGTEAVIPVEVGVPTRRMLENGDNEKSLRENLDVLEERREVAAIREAKYKQNVARYYNKNVKSFQFKEGDLVLRNNEASRVLPGGKLSPNWEGPYQILEVLDKGSYVLGNADGSRVPRTWNGLHLRKYNI